MSQPPVPIATMLMICARLGDLVKRWEDESEPQNTIMVIDRVVIIVAYVPETKIVRVLLAAKGIDLAACGDSLKRSIQLVTRQLWKSKRRDGFVGLVDEQLSPRFVNREEFEMKVTRITTQ